MAAQPRNSRAARSFTVERARRPRGGAGSARREPVLACLVDLQDGAGVWHEATGRPLLGQFATCGALHVVSSRLVRAPRVSSPGAVPPGPDELCHQEAPRGAAATSGPPGARSDAKARLPCRSGARAHGASLCRRAAQEQRQDGEHEGERSRRERRRAAGSRSSARPALRCPPCARARPRARRGPRLALAPRRAASAGRRVSGSRRRNPCRRCGRRACRPSRQGTRGRSSAAASRPPCRWRARGHRGNPARP